MTNLNIECIIRRFKKLDWSHKSKPLQRFPFCPWYVRPNMKSNIIFVISITNSIEQWVWKQETRVTVILHHMHLTISSDYMHLLEWLAHMDESWNIVWLAGSLFTFHSIQIEHSLISEICWWETKMKYEYDNDPNFAVLVEIDSSAPLEYSLLFRFLLMSNENKRLVLVPFAITMMNTTGKISSHF
jgi:hypothetical protein